MLFVLALLAFREIAVGVTLGVVLFFLLPFGERPLVHVLPVLQTFREIAVGTGFGVVFPVLLALSEAAFVLLVVFVLVMRHRYLLPS